MIRSAIATLLLLTAMTGQAQAQPRGPAPVRAENPDAILPPEFRGKVLYFGNHSGEVIESRDRTDKRGPRADCPRPDQRCPERIGGSLEVELEFDGDVVRGIFRGTGGLRESGLIGRRQGAQCRLFDLADGSVWAGRCDAEGFSGTVKSVPNAHVQVSLNFESVGTRVRDYGEWERRRREAIARKRRFDWLQATLAGSGPIEGRFEAAVELDAFGWPFERLRPGTLHNVRRTKEKRGVYEISGEFELENGKAGWARARVENDQIACIEFWNAPGVCRAIRRPPPPEVPEETPPATETSLLIFRDAMPGVTGAR